MCLSKGLTSGYLALGATLTTDKIYQAFYADYKKGKTFFHGHTLRQIRFPAALPWLA